MGWGLEGGKNPTEPSGELGHARARVQLATEIHDVWLVYAIN